MEKLVYLVPTTTSQSLPALLGQLPGLAELTRGLAVLTPVPASADSAPYGAALCVWFSCLDRRIAFEHALSDLRVEIHGYLVTEAVLHGAGSLADLAAQPMRPMRVTLLALRQAPQLGQAELRARLTALSPALRTLAGAQHIARDLVVRPLQTSCPPLRALYTIAHEIDLTLSTLDRMVEPLGSERARGEYTRRVVRPRGLGTLSAASVVDASARRP